jgi:signal transduction histidine kinase
VKLLRRLAPEGRTLTIRTTLLLFVGFVILYVVLIAGYITWRVGPVARTMRADTQPVLEVFRAISERTARLDTAVADAHRLVSGDTRMRRDRLRRIGPFVSGERGPGNPPAFSRVPPELRGMLARTDEQVTRMQSLLGEASALMALGRTADAQRQVRRADSLQAQIGLHLTRAQEIGLAGQLARERALSRAAADALRAVRWWVLGGLLLFPIAWLLVRQRVQRPLAALERGLAEVAAGDLTARVRVARGDELGRLTMHFNETTRVLRDRAQEQGRFTAAGQLIAGVAHEVNNPLMAIMSLVDARLDDPATPPGQRAELQQIWRQARRASRLLSGLLRFVRTEGEERAAAIDVNAVARSATELVAYQFAVEQIVLDDRLDGSIPAALGHFGRIEQVLVNLLSNAVDAMRGAPPPHRLTVESWAAGGMVHFAVTDTGPGVSPAVAARLFRPFVTSKGTRGTGLGLYISRQIVREAGGDLTLAPVPSGARFVMTLPATQRPGPRLEANLARGAAATPSAPPPAAPTPATGALDGVRILVVDDEEAVRSPVVRYLRRRGATVHEAGDGLEALTSIAGDAPDVILADLRMPRMDGVALYARLLEDRPELALRFVLISGDITQFVDAGDRPRPERVLLKPIELAEVEAAVREVAG